MNYWENVNKFYHVGNLDLDSTTQPSRRSSYNQPYAYGHETQFCGLKIVLLIGSAALDDCYRLVIGYSFSENTYIVCINLLLFLGCLN